MIFVFVQQASQSQIRHFPLFPLSNGLYASKIGLEFQVQVDDTAALAKNRKTSFYSPAQSIKGARPTIKSKQYRIKCVALMEKTIYSHKSEIHLGVAKRTSGLHLSAGSSALNGNLYLKLQKCFLNHESNNVFVLICQS